MNWKITGWLKKNQTVATVGLIVACAIAFLWVTPTINNINKVVTETSTIAANVLVDSTGEGLQKVIDLQDKIADTKTDGIWMLYMNWLTLSFIGVTMTGMLAWWLQHIFTNLSFTKKKFTDEDGILNKQDRYNSMSVLAASLISAALIVLMSAYVVFAILSLQQ